MEENQNKDTPSNDKKQAKTNSAADTESEKPKNEAELDIEPTKRDGAALDKEEPKSDVKKDPNLTEDENGGAVPGAKNAGSIGLGTNFGKTSGTYILAVVFSAFFALLNILTITTLLVFSARENALNLSSSDSFISILFVSKSILSIISFFAILVLLTVIFGTNSDDSILHAAFKPDGQFIKLHKLVKSTNIAVRFTVGTIITIIVICFTLLDTINHTTKSFAICSEKAAEILLEDIEGTNCVVSGGGKKGQMICQFEGEIADSKQLMIEQDTDFLQRKIINIKKQRHEVETTTELKNVKKTKSEPVIAIRAEEMRSIMLALLTTSDHRDESSGDVNYISARLLASTAASYTETIPPWDVNSYPKRYNSHNVALIDTLHYWFWMEFLNQLPKSEDDRSGAAVKLRQFWKQQVTGTNQTAEYFADKIVKFAFDVIKDSDAKCKIYENVKPVKYIYNFARHVFVISGDLKYAHKLADMIDLVEESRCEWNGNEGWIFINACILFRKDKKFMNLKRCKEMESFLKTPPGMDMRVFVHNCKSFHPAKDVYNKVKENGYFDCGNGKKDYHYTR